MDLHTKYRIKKLAKAMSKKAKESSVIADVFDNDNVAEVSPDEVKPGKGGVLNKSKNKKTLDKCEGKKDCDCDCPMEKGEDFVQDILSKFEKISDAYLKKKSLKKAKIDEGLNATGKKKARAERKPGFISNTKPKTTKDGFREMPKPSDIKGKLRDKFGKQPKQQDLEYPLAASEKKK